MALRLSQSIIIFHVILLLHYLHLILKLIVVLILLLRKGNQKKFTKYMVIILRDLNAYNPAFDITPAELLTGIITEKGIIEQPLKKNILKLINHN